MSPPDENKEYFLALQQMIEEMADRAGAPVVLIAHSMGNMYTLYFLNQQPQAWKDKYIKAFICLGPPWGGVAKTLRVIISGTRADDEAFVSPGATDRQRPGDANAACVRAWTSLLPPQVTTTTSR